MRFQHSHILPVALVLLTAMMIIWPASGAAAGTAAAEIARVNDTVVLQKDLDREMKLIALKMKRQGRPIGEAQLKRYAGEIRETLINRILLQKKAQAAGITARNSQVAQALEEFKAGFQNDRDYQQTLAEMGFSEAMLTEQIKNGLAIKTLIDRTVIQKIYISDKQIRSFYDDNPDLFRQPEQVRASHILIESPADADEAKKADALAAIQSIKQRIAGGENFAALAMDSSDCPSKEKGGDLGFFSREQMVKPFADAAFAMQKGQVSDVVTTRFGYHLVKVTDRKAEQTMPFPSVKETIFARLRQEQEEKKIANYLEKLKEDADIKRFPM